MKPENQMQELFEKAASAMDKMTISNEELMLCIKVLRAIEAYFSIRGTFYGLIKSRISQELDTYLGFVAARGLSK
jgi:hypothetical protein